MKFATLASKAEIAKDYRSAEELWGKAYEFCYCYANIEWVTRRIDFCRHRYS
ncbi:TPA: ANR family transcriptional regulator [Salmonella enterica subsp. enterica serovar Singapore]